MPLRPIQPLDPQLLRHPFDDPEWVFEIKLDGFRALAYIEDGRCEFVSKKGNVHSRGTPAVDESRKYYATSRLKRNGR